MTLFVVELSTEQALIAASLLQKADVEFYPMRSLLAEATRLAIELDHPAYDCVYLAFAIERNCRMVAADERFLRIAAKDRRGRDHSISLHGAGSI